MHDYHFFSSGENFTKEHVTLTDDEFKHCCRVLRYKVGDEISVFDGSGKLFTARIVDIGKNVARAKILETVENNSYNSLKIHLAVGLVKSKALDLIIDQATSLGIHSFYPVETENSVKKSFNLTRYRKKCLESLKQSGRLLLPDIFDIYSFSELLDEFMNMDTKMLCYQHSQNKLFDMKIENTAELLIFIGPEGGFSEKEITAAQNAGFKTVNLFDGRLRTELAVTTALAGIHTLHRR